MYNQINSIGGLSQRFIDQKSVNPHMALSKVNLVRLKSGDAPEAGSIIIYEAGSKGLYNTKTQAAFVDEIEPMIQTSKLNNDVPFLDDTTQSIKYIEVQDNTIAPFNQIINLGAHDDLVFSHGAYAEHWTSELSPNAASGKHGDLWFVIG
jgi:hypothetical protein